MAKERISASLDPDVRDYVSRESVNASGLINKLLRQHMAGGVSDTQMLDLRIEQVKSELADLEGQTERKREELESLKERRSEIQNESRRVLEEAFEALTERDVEAKNRKVEFWANKADMTPDELVDKLRSMQED